MEIKYKFNANYKKQLSSFKDIDSKFEYLVGEPKGNLIFENKKYSTSKYEIDPEMLFWWVDRVTGQFENENFKSYEEEIIGLPYNIMWKNNKISITFVDKSNGSINIFEEKISKKEIFEIFRDFSKMIQKQMEEINPLVKKSKNWNSYYFVKHYNQ